MDTSSSDPYELLRTKNACIYSNERLKLSKSLLSELDGITEVECDGGFFRRPTYFRMRVGDTRLQLNTNFDRERIREHVKGMHGWVDQYHQTSPIMNLETFHAYIDQITQMYGVQVESDFRLDSPLWKAIIRIAQPIEGVIFVQNSFVDCDGDVLFGQIHDLFAEDDQDDH
jgi:hypothetical protein